MGTKKGGARKGKPKGSRLAYDDLERRKRKAGKRVIDYEKKGRTDGPDSPLKEDYYGPEWAEIWGEYQTLREMSQMAKRGELIDWIMRKWRLF